MTLTTAERQYLRRFLYESLYQLNYKTEANRPAYYIDLCYLSATFIENQDDADLIADVFSDNPDPTKLAANYLEVQFPWESPEALHSRVQEAASEHHDIGLLKHTDTIFKFVQLEYPDLKVIWRYPLPHNHEAVIIGHAQSNPDPIILIKLKA